MAFALMSAPVMASDPSPVRLGADVIYLISPGYHQFLNDAFSGVSGGYGWIGADVGLLIRMTDRFALQPKIEGYFNAVNVSQRGTSDTTNLNVMGVPALALKTYLYQNGAMELGLNAQIGVPMISTELPGVTMKRDGLGYAFSGSMRLKKSVDIQLGYSYYPIRVTPTQVAGTLAAAPRPAPVSFFLPPLTGLAGAKTYNFGGVFLSAGYYF